MPKSSKSSSSTSQCSTRSIPSCGDDPARAGHLCLQPLSSWCRTGGLPHHRGVLDRDDRNRSRRAPRRLRARHPPRTQRARPRRFLSSPVVHVLDVDDEAAQIYAEIVVALRAAGTSIPTNDIWIVAVAAREGVHVVTYDAHFGLIARVGTHVLPD
ncbi:MAG TPA: PIN domain-containing protein [Kofleriaceae bacterium]